ncbi:MAG: hypothetical protein C4B58_08130 [Deltaproteobacteria bacterium]|nr:MAG: hypothetical protein C4B58_08130 [Deltaproteobacteria bacterium]
MEIDLGKVLDTLMVWVTQYSVKLVAAILIIIIGRWISRRISRLLGRLLEKNNVDITLVRFMENLTYYALIVVVLIAAVGQLGINTTSFLTIVGAAGLAIGLALKDSLSNFAAGVMLILFRPFQMGDFVDAGGVTGTVQGITMFNTILNTPDNQQVIIPNVVEDATRPRQSPRIAIRRLRGAPRLTTSGCSRLRAQASELAHVLATDPRRV